MPEPATPMFPWRHPAQAELESLLKSHVGEAAFPCVGAKAALAKGTLNVLACNRIDSAWDDLRIHARARWALDSLEPAGAPA